MNKVVVFGTVIVGLLGLIFLFKPEKAKMNESSVSKSTATITTPVEIPEGKEIATIAGGCFWCTEAVFQETEGIDDVISGYAGGQEVNPTYQAVYTNSTGHREAIQFLYDPSKIAFEEILDILWQAINPTDDGGQFVDRGFAYTTAVFYHNDEQKQQIEESHRKAE